MRACYVNIVPCVSGPEPVLTNGPSFVQSDEKVHQFDVVLVLLRLFRTSRLRRVGYFT